MSAQPLADRQADEYPTDAYAPVPAPAAAAPARRTISVRLSAAIAAGTLVVGIALGALTGGLAGPGGPGGQGGPPPGASTGQNGTGTSQQGTVPDGSGAATQGTTGTGT